MEYSLDEMMFMWFDMKYRMYNKLLYGNSIYLYYGGEKFADFCINKNINRVYYNIENLNEFYQVFPLDDVEYEEILSIWIDNTFNTKNIVPIMGMISLNSSLYLPK